MRLSKKSCLFAIAILMGLSSFAAVKAQFSASPADQYVASGQQLLRANNYTQAFQYFSAAIKVDPNNVAAYQGLGNCYYMAGRKSDALTYYQRALALQPGNAQLAQFVQNLQAQLNPAPAGGMYGSSGMATGMPGSAGYGTGVPGSMGLATDPMTQGVGLFQQKQYAAAIPYFQSASQQNPNDYRAFYYMGYAYYMINNARLAALYFAVANLKQPNASIQAYADRVKALLSSDDQQWVGIQLSQYSASPNMASNGATVNGGAVKPRPQFGFYFMGGSSYVFSNPSQIINGAQNAGSVSLSGTTPNMITEIGMEPYVQFGQDFELDFGFNYIPLGNLAYSWVNSFPVTDGNLNPVIANNQAVYGYSDTFNTKIVAVELGFKILMCDSDMKAYLGLGGDIAPVSTTFNKFPTDATGALIDEGAEEASSGPYSAVAVGGYARVGVDFYLSKNMALGPFAGIQVLSASNFTNGDNVLSVNPANGDVGVPGLGSLAGVVNTTPLTLDYSNISFGVNLEFTF